MPLGPCRCPRGQSGFFWVMSGSGCTALQLECSLSPSVTHAQSLESRANIFEVVSLGECARKEHVNRQQTSIAKWRVTVKMTVGGSAFSTQASSVVAG